MRIPVIICAVGLLIALASSLLSPKAPKGPGSADAATPDVPEWETYRHDQLELAALDTTGPDLLWSEPEVKGNTRLFLSDHPESIGMPLDPRNPDGSRWPSEQMEGTLWADEASGESQVTYQVFISHQNWFNKPIYIGIHVSNLSADTSFTVTGKSVTTVGAPDADARKSWANMTMIGKRNAYADLSDTLCTALPERHIAVGRNNPPAENELLHWKVAPGETLGVRMRLTLRKDDGQPGPVRCRLATAWAWNVKTLTNHLELIPRKGSHPRGSWATSEVVLNNREDPFDLGKDEKDGRTVRLLRLCQPVYDAAGTKTGYRRDVVYLPSNSFNASQAKMNNGMYGVRTHAMLHVKNSGTREETVGLYLRYPDKRLEGSYVGAATTYRFNETTKEWEPQETRAVDLSRRTYGDRATGQVTQRDWWFSTTCMATYTVKAGATMDIPLTITTDFPAMLPLAIVLRKEPHQ